MFFVENGGLKHFLTGFAGNVNVIPFWDFDADRLPVLYLKFIIFPDIKLFEKIIWAEAKVACPQSGASSFGENHLIWKSLLPIFLKKAISDQL